MYCPICNTELTCHNCGNFKTETVAGIVFFKCKGEDGTSCILFQWPDDGTINHIQHFCARHTLFKRFSLKDLALQALSLLVMDLSYEQAPIYGDHPIRHQFMWDMCADILGENLPVELKKMIKQRDEEKSR